MKSILRIFIIAIGIAMVAGTAAWAADATDTAGATVGGTNRVELTISTSDLEVEAPTGVGPSTTSIGTVSMEVLDNYISAAWGSRVDVKITGTVPDQYGTTYYLYSGATSFSTATDSEIFSGDLSVGSYTYNLATYDNNVVTVIKSPIEDGSRVWHGTAHQPLYLLINSGKRIYGDTADTIILQYTLTDG